MRIIVYLLLISPFYLFAQKKSLSNAALERTKYYVIYTPNYIGIEYPNGDVPEGTGVCTDVIIRAYRNAFSFDFQKAIHEDMKINFTKYPSKKIWGASGPDKNIDHRRTQNMECYLTRKGAKLPVTDNPNDYKPGDIVFYGHIASGHVGIVVDKYVDGRPKIVHNIGAGPKCEDFLFESPITGHYRFIPE